MRAVLDPNVLISSLLSPDGTPARLLKAWIHGEFELVISPLMVAELARALAYPKLRKRIDPDEAASVVEWLKATAEDPESGIAKVVFIAGKLPADGKLPPNIVAVEGTRTEVNGKTIWLAELPVATEKKGTVEAVPQR